MMNKTNVVSVTSSNNLLPRLFKKMSKSVQKPKAKEIKEAKLIMILKDESHTEILQSSTKSTKP